MVSTSDHDTNENPTSQASACTSNVQEPFPSLPKEDDAEDVTSNTPKSRLVTLGPTPITPGFPPLNNATTSSKYTIYNFLPLTISFQFRRVANFWFLLIGIVMSIGYYTDLYESPVSPWPTLVPLILVVSMSVVQEARADIVRRRSDAVLNESPVVILKRVGTEEEDDEMQETLLQQQELAAFQKKRQARGYPEDEVVKVRLNPPGSDVQSPPGSCHGGGNTLEVQLQTVPLRSIRAGQLVLVRNRDMIPADLVLLATSAPGGGAYIETSSIDGETNLKARASAQPRASRQTTATKLQQEQPEKTSSKPSSSTKTETLPQAIGRIASVSTLGLPHGRNVLELEDASSLPHGKSRRSFMAPLWQNISRRSRSFGSSLRQSISGSIIPTQSQSQSQSQSQQQRHSTSGGYTPLRPTSPGSTIPMTIPAVSPFAAKSHVSLRHSIGDVGWGTLRRLSATAGNSTRRSAEAAAQRVRERERNKRYVGMITAEVPNASVHTFTGKLSLPRAVSVAENNGETLEEAAAAATAATAATATTTKEVVSSTQTGGESLLSLSSSSEVEVVHVPLSADHLLLRGAFLRNTEWAIGVAVYVGTDTKLVRNSSRTPSKFSLVEKTVNRYMMLAVLTVLLIIALQAYKSVSSLHHHFSELWYLGFETNTSKPWPYLAASADHPQWTLEATPYYIFFLVHMSVLNQFVPLSMYISLEIMTLMFLFYINWDRDMYHKETDTPAQARNTNVTDLGQVEYIFSDKTGTLTQNVMTFRRCSVDGRIFGKPLVKASPQSEDGEKTRNDDGKLEGKEQPASLSEDQSPWQQHLDLTDMLLPKPKPQQKHNASDSSSPHPHLSFNEEMFLRVMSMCHTVVVEKNDKSQTNNACTDLDGSKKAGKRSKWKDALKRKANSTAGSSEREEEESQSETSPDGASRECCNGTEEETQVPTPSFDGKVEDDGAPLGYSFQAESPDEGALVSAASLVYGFHFLERDSDSLTVACATPTLFQHKEWTQGLKSGTLTSKMLEAMTVKPYECVHPSAHNGHHEHNHHPVESTQCASLEEETWHILAINKFDSTRKRMSVLARSPPQYGSIPILFCKGADSSMLDPQVCDGADEILGEENHKNIERRISRSLSLATSTSISLGSSNGDGEEEQIASLLGMENHLGVFASEGLRTLVLGVRILSEEECSSWLNMYREAENALSKREDRLTEAAQAIETRLHIVGATAIEDKLQDGVPDAIANIAAAGIKLWVLTGDKRETAIEIGYSTKVLTPSMHVTQIVNGPKETVQLALAAEFMRLTKMGKLPLYQRKALQQGRRRDGLKKCLQRRKGLRRLAVRRWRKIKQWLANWIRRCRGEKQNELSTISSARKAMEEEDLAVAQVRSVIPQERRKEVRERAENILREASPKKTVRKQNNPKQETSASNVNAPPNRRRSTAAAHYASPLVFRNSVSSFHLLNLLQVHGHLSEVILTPPVLNRHEEICPAITFDEEDEEDEEDGEDQVQNEKGEVDEEEDVGSILSRKSVHQRETRKSDFHQPTIFERCFAVDPDVRNGRLNKHHRVKFTKHTKGEEQANSLPSLTGANAEEGDNSLRNEYLSRALVIEGAALSHLLGDPTFEEMLFAVASCSASVIACRVSPKQKALLVKLASDFALSKSVTLAVGDGANDVGMIQQADVGVGISGLEGQQAVNSADFAVAQFRYLESLLLVHGRWNYLRMTKMIMLTFYTNIVLSGILVAYGEECLFGGTPVFSAWLISFVNAVVRIPVVLLGLFDRDITKSYVRRHPQVYAVGQNNECMLPRTALRWILTIVLHVGTIYYLTVGPALGEGGAYTSAWDGLMKNESPTVPGEGEGGGLNSFGLQIYLVMCFTFLFKVMYETRSFIHGECPPCTCRKDEVNKDTWESRLPYTWIGICFLSVGLVLIVYYLLENLGADGNAEFAPLFRVTTHTLNMRSSTWMLVLLSATTGTVIDVAIKMFGNMFFPTQTQIHMERALGKGLHGDSHKQPKKYDTIDKV